MPPKKQNVKSEYKSKLKLDLEKLKNREVQATKVDLTKINIRKLAKRISALSEDVKCICTYSIQRDIMLQMLAQLIC